MYPHACACAHGNTHTVAHTHRHNSCYCAKSLALFSVLFLSFMFLELLDWIRPSLVSVWYSALSVMAMTSHHYPMVGYIPTRGTARLQRFTTQLNRGWGPLKAKPHPSQQSVLCTVPLRGILWENIDYFILIIVGEDWESKRRGCGGLNGLRMPPWVGVNSSDCG